MGMYENKRKKRIAGTHIRSRVRFFRKFAPNVGLGMAAWPGDAIPTSPDETHFKPDPISILT
jgi:hypothetical protein